MSENKKAIIYAAAKKLTGWLKNESKFHQVGMTAKIAKALDGNKAATKIKKMLTDAGVDNYQLTEAIENTVNAVK